MDGTDHRPQRLHPAIRAGVRDLRIARLPEATHWLVHEQPDEVARVIRRFIDDAAD
ncbi:MAG: hypothetical protein QM674_00845 [Burkholderiaceae bacterium]